MNVKTKYGEIEGIRKEGYTVYKGIPYAKPPVGELRWRAPQEQEPWEGVYEAKEFGAICPQSLPEEDNPFTGRFCKEFYNDPEFIPEMSEDCLYLNIWAPENPENKKLPVAFWIHGGGFGGGYSSEMEFDGEAYCKKEVILVTINYRVNIYGFLAHPWLDAENERGISGNYGILDQIAALTWVYENIAAFGGDPENITVFGQSAGSMSTQVLISSELTGNMIAKAIMQSGINCEKDFLYTPTLQEEEEIGAWFVELTGAADLTELRQLSIKEIAEAKEKLDARTWEMGKGIVIVPNVDGHVLKETVGEVYRNGNMKNIPYMAGCVTDDLGSTPEEVQAKKTGVLCEENKSWSLRQEELWNRASYVYHFAHELPGDDWGSFHSAELWYTFGTLGRCWRPMVEEDYQLSAQMVDYWTNFMKTGNPNGVGLANWEPCTKEKPVVKKF